MSTHYTFVTFNIKESVRETKTDAMKKCRLQRIIIPNNINL